MFGGGRKRAVITGARLAFGGLATTLACLQSAAAQDNGSIQEKRLRAGYCLGYFLAQMNYMPKFCADVRMQNCQQEVTQRNITMRQRLAMYLIATGGMGDTVTATVQGKLDASQCFLIIDNPRVLDCEVACYQKRVAQQTPAEAVRTTEEALRYCEHECNSICAKVFDCVNYDPW